MRTRFAKPCKTAKIFVLLAKVFSFRKDFNGDIFEFHQGTFQILVHEGTEKTTNTKHYNRSISNIIQVKNNQVYI